jgi:hypothetical protein
MRPERTSGLKEEPSRWVIGLLQWFGPRGWAEEIDTEMVEVYERRLRRSGRPTGSLIYIWDVLSSVRNFILMSVSKRVLPYLGAPFSKALHYPLVYLVFFVYLVSPQRLQPSFHPLFLPLAVLASLVGMLIGLGRIRPDTYWGTVAGNLGLSLYALLCLVDRYVEELAPETWARGYGFILGVVLVFGMRWLWPQLFDFDSERARASTALTVLRVETSELDSERRSVHVETKRQAEE